MRFSYTKNAEKRHVTCEGFENAASRANDCVILTSRSYVCFCACYWWWRQILWRPRNAYKYLYVKPQNRVFNSTWIHLIGPRFVLIKTWLLIVGLHESQSGFHKKYSKSVHLDFKCYLSLVLRLPVDQHMLWSIPSKPSEVIFRTFWRPSSVNIRLYMFS